MVSKVEEQTFGWGKGELNPELRCYLAQDLTSSPT
jgi:hypothetical protein